MEVDQENQSLPIKKDKDNHESLTPIPGDRKLQVVLKIPKMKVEKYSKIGPQENNQIRACSECHKKFSSGKALGGHMRIHVQKNKLLSLKKLKPNKTIKFKNQHQSEDIFLMKNKNKKKTNNKTTNVCLGNNKKPKCIVCGKNFPSMKSLFGHMRCHPEREWRGIQPPPVPKNTPSSSLSDDLLSETDDRIDLAGTSSTLVIDLAVSLRGWLVTAMRGRKANNPTWFSSSSEDEFRDAADDLMRLAKGDSFDSSGLTHKHRSEEMEATYSNSLTYRAEIEDTNRVLDSDKGIVEVSQVEHREDYSLKKLRVEERFVPTYDGNIGGLLSKSMRIDQGKENIILETDHFFAEKSVDIDCQWDDDTCSEDTEQFKYQESTKAKAIVMKNKKKRKKMKLVDLGYVVTPPYQKPVGGTTSSIPGQYRCSTCYKCFPSHQALGGHRSSHNKFKINIHNAIDESSSAAAEVENPACPITQQDEIRESEGAAWSKLVDNTHHQCKIFNKTFPTGQTLGGHKTCHWTGPLEDAPSSQVTSQGTGHKILPFDLNELPPVEDEGGLIESEHGTGYGDASSSYNSVA